MNASPLSFSIRSIAAAIALLACLPAHADQKPVTFEQQQSASYQLQYLLSLPEGYHKDPDKKWQQVIFLHGSGERGSDINKVKMHGPPMEVFEQKLP